MKFDTLYDRLLEVSSLQGDGNYLSLNVIEKIAQHVALDIIRVLHLAKSRPSSTWPRLIREPHKYSGELIDLVDAAYKNLISQENFLKDIVAKGITPNELVNLRFQIYPRVMDLITQSGVLAPSESGDYPFTRHE